MFKLVTLLALAACVTQDGADTGKTDVGDDDCPGTATGSELPFYADTDGDGYGDAGATVSACSAPEGYVDNADDCDDTDATALPGGTETCDGVDNDCDDAIDEAGASGEGSWYTDADADGYGDAAGAVTACEPPTGTVANDDDCDDADPAVNPAAEELCNGIDDDCDSVVDEPDATDVAEWYADADADGYGDSATGATACAPPEGFVADGGDCNDADAAVNPGAVELCNGVDDNCDTTVDEGAADLDGDGVYDCFDDACVLAAAPGGTVVVDETCLAPDITVTDPWSAEVEWQWVNLSTSSSVRDSYVTPKVGNLTDTDGDGDIDADDTPNVLVNTLSGGGHVVLLAGDTGAEIWSVSGVYPYGENAIADVNGDGENDVLTFNSSRQALLLDASGAVIWTSTVATSTTYPMVTVADVDADGVAEVITNSHVLDGRTGAVEATFAAPSGIPYYSPTVGDIDLDGQQEIILGNVVYSPDGTVEWTSSVAGSYGHWSAIVNVDADPEGEVLMVGGSMFVVHDHDGTVLYSTTTTAAARPGPLCVADFDGDGTVEAAWGSQSVFSVFELDATAVWSSTIEDSSGLAGCSAYDFNGDGVYEALIADQSTLRVFDGATGVVRFSQDGHTSGTVFEYPVVADVDNDGSSEILYVSNYFSTGGATLTVLGHTGGEWPRSGSTWPIHDFAATNIEIDGGVPTDPTPSWQVYNVYRARPSVDSAATNLYVEIVDSCASSCDDTVGALTVSVQVSNEGGIAITEAVNVVLYDADTDTALDSVTLAGGLAEGELSAGLELSALLADVGAGGVYVLVDDDGLGGGYLDECDESDNRVAWSGPVCD